MVVLPFLCAIVSFSYRQKVTPVLLLSKLHGGNEIVGAKCLAGHLHPASTSRYVVLLVSLQKERGLFLCKPQISASSALARREFASRRSRTIYGIIEVEPDDLILLNQHINLHCRWKNEKALCLCNYRLVIPARKPSFNAADDKSFLCAA